MKCPHCGKETENAGPTMDRVFAAIFDHFQKFYPSRSGGQRWPEARKNFERLARNGIPVDVLCKKSRQYGEHCRQRGILGSEYVMQAATFLGRARGWEEDWSTETPFDQARRQLQEQS